MQDTTQRGRVAVLAWATVGFTLMFAVWLMFGVLAIPIRDEFGLTDQQLSWISAVAVLNGSIWRLPAGMIADHFGGKRTFIAMLVATSIPAYLVSQATSYSTLLLYAFLVGFAGNSFSVGIAWVSAWWPREHQGFALGVFGAGNVGASVTKFIGPALIAAVAGTTFIPGGWRFVPFLYVILLLITALGMWFFTPHQEIKPAANRSFTEMLVPLKQTRVWRFGMYYTVVFGAYVALAAWLPKYYVDVYDQSLWHAALLTAIFIFPASLLRPFGGHLSDKFGARKVMYATFAVMLGTSGILMMPYGYIVLSMPDGVEREVLPWSVDVTFFTILVFLLGCAMGVGKAAVYKHIPEYFPNDVGSVGGLVGSLGALGGFFMPPLFAYSAGWLGMPQATFLVVFVLTLISALWMHLTVVSLLHQASPELTHKFEHEEEDVTT
jgi:MFS transporter, NNP family, nitrate/nitrite transporter